MKFSTIKRKYVYRVNSDLVLEPTVVEKAVRKREVEGFDALCIHNTSDPLGYSNCFIRWLYSHFPKHVRGIFFSGFGIFGE